MDSRTLMSSKSLAKLKYLGMTKSRPRIETHHHIILRLIEYLQKKGSEYENFLILRFFINVSIYCLDFEIFLKQNLN